MAARIVFDSILDFGKRRLTGSDQCVFEGVNSLSFQQGHSSPDRRMYFITEGLLAKGSDGLYPRMEFRDVLNGRYTIVALHDFIPVLPWGLYFVTQAIIHMIVMRNFQKYIAKIASGLSPRN